MTTNVHFQGQLYKVSKEAIAKAPLIKIVRDTAYLDEIVKIVDVPNHPVEHCHIAALVRIMEGAQITPSFDLKSHADVFVLLLVAEAIGMTNDSIAEGFQGWTERQHWLTLWLPEYIYLVYDKMEELVDWNRFFASMSSDNSKPFEHIQLALSTGIYKQYPKVLIDMLSFYQSFKFETIFEGNNNEIQKRIQKLNHERQLVIDLFLINPYEYVDYFVYNMSSDPCWSHEGISIVQSPAVGERTIAPFGELIDRFHKLSHGLFLKSPNPQAKEFPFANVAFAGGSTSKLLGSNYTAKTSRQSDIDIFIFAKTPAERSKYFEMVLRWFDTPNTYYALRGSVTSIYIKDIPRKFQIVSQNAATVWDVIGRFDLTNVQWALLFGGIHNGTPITMDAPLVLGTPAACQTMRTKLARYTNAKNVRVNRMIKALYNGYSLLKDRYTLENIIDITDLVTNPKENQQLQTIIRGLYQWYYPESSKFMEPDEENIHILSMIEKDSNATTVSKDINTVLNNIIVSGNFDSDYESISYRTFKVENIQQRVIRPGRNEVFAMRSRHGIIRLTSCVFTVHGIVASDEGITISVNVVDEDFREFIRTLEGPAWRIVTGNNRRVTKTIIDESDHIVFNIQKYRLDAQARRGVSILRSQQGIAMNIEEDLKEGNQLQVLFMIEITSGRDERSLQLKPIRYIKYCDPAKDEAKAVANENETIIEEIEQIAKEMEFKGDIKYEEMA